MDEKQQRYATKKSDPAQDFELSKDDGSERQAEM
jgi:hypothetical protein